MTTHLRSTHRPEAERTQGRFLVFTECGAQVDAVLVDNEHAECGDCTRIDRRRALLLTLAVWAVMEFVAGAGWFNERQVRS